jgi:hypothetical protein
VLGVVHVDHGTEELVDLDGQVADVGTGATLEQVGVTADMPDVVMANKCAIARPGRNGGVFNQAFFEEVEGGLIAKSLERAITPVAGLCPELRVREIDICERYNGKIHAGRIGDSTVVCMAEFTFFVDADLYMMNGGELAATEEDLHEMGVWGVDIPKEYGMDLGDRVPVRVNGSSAGIRFYSKLLGMKDPLQIEEMDRVLAAAEAKEASSEE